MDFDALYNNEFVKVFKKDWRIGMNKIFCKPCRVLCRGQILYKKHCNTLGHLETMKTRSTQGALLFLLKYKSKTSVVGLQNVVVFSCINHPAASLIYYCRLCNFVERNKFDNHMRSCHHQYLYIKTDYPEMIPFECDNFADQEVSTKIREVAQSIEEKDGIGELQELKVSFDKYSRLVEKNADVAEEIFLEEMEAKNKEKNSQAESSVNAKSADPQPAKIQEFKKTSAQEDKPEDCSLPLAANSVTEPTDHLDSQYMLDYEMGRRSEKQNEIPEWEDIVKRQRIMAQSSSGMSSVNSPCQPVSNPLYFQSAAHFDKMRGGRTVERGRYKHAGGINFKEQRRIRRQMPTGVYANEASRYAAAAAAAVAQNGRTLSDATQGQNYIGAPSAGVQLSSWGTAASRSYAAGFPPYMFTSIASTGVLQNYRGGQESGYQVTSHPLAVTSTPDVSKFRTVEPERSSSKAKPDKLPPLDYLTLFKNMLDKASKKQEVKATAVTQNTHKEEETQETATPSSYSADYVMPEPQTPQTSSSRGYVRVRLGPDRSNTDRCDNMYIPSASSETFASLTSSHHSRDGAYSSDFEYPPAKAPFFDDRNEFQCDSQTPETSSSRGYVRVRLGPDTPKTGGSDQANSTFCSSKMASFLPSSHQDSKHTYSSSSAPLADPIRHLNQMSQYKPEIPESSGSRGYMRVQLDP